MRIARLAGRQATSALEQSVAALDPSAPMDYRELAALLAAEWAEDPPRRVGLCGGQGAGKTTLSRLIAAACQGVGKRVCVLSLDDFYSPLSVRKALAADVHPLLETRGPAGTHDLAACQEAMARLGNDEAVSLPVFDKGRDDRGADRSVRGPFDLVLLEGWCVGASSQQESELVLPINSLEETEDSDGTWRRFVNTQLSQAYAELWGTLDYLIYLRVPDLTAVRRWRLEQETERSADLRLSPEAVDRFVQHFERTTLEMDRSLPGRADLVVGLSPDHAVSSLDFGSKPEST